MRPLFFEGRLSLGVDQRRCRVRKLSLRVDTGRLPLSFDEQGPARSKSTQDIVQPSRNADELCRHRRVEIGPPETGRPLE